VPRLGQKLVASSWAPSDAAFPVSARVQHPLQCRDLHREIVRLRDNPRPSSGHDDALGNKSPGLLEKKEKDLGGANRSRPVPRCPLRSDD
jgi:hypothetical protein